MKLPHVSQARAITWTAAAGVLLPILLDLAAGGRAAPFRYLASDSFYYFTIARNIALHGSPSYDGVLPTNGFHPLWQWVAAAEYAAVHALGLSDAVFLWLVVLSNAAAVTTAVVLFGRALTDSRGRLSPWFAAAPLGLYGLIAAPLWLRYVLRGDLAAQGGPEGPQPLFGTLWSFVNGMESGVLLLAFAACALMATTGHWRRSRSAALWLGAAFAALSLARLDHAVFPLCFVAWHLPGAVRARDKRLAIQAVLVAAPVVIALVAYLAANQAICGMALPISGTMKSSFPEWMTSNWTAVTALVRKPHSHMWLARAWRIAQVVLPAISAAALLGWTFKVRSLTAVAPERTRWATSFWGSSALAVLLLAGYNGAFVALFHQGHWYFPVSTVVMSLGTLHALSTSLDRALLTQRPRLWTIVAAVMSFATFFGLHRQPGYHARQASFFFVEAPRVVAHYGGQSIRLFERDDGIIAFALPYPAVSGTGLALDRAGADALLHGELLRLSVDRGFDRVVSLTYLDASELALGMSTREILERLPKPWQQADDLRGLALEVEYKSADGKFAVLRVWRP